MSCYLPSKWKRLKELKNAVTTLIHPPSATWQPDDILIVCDAIFAYTSLFNADCINAVNNLIESAKTNNIEIVFTKWSRTSRKLNDAIDTKGHWSDYVPGDQTDLLFSVHGIHVVDVYHTNALCSPEVEKLLINKKRIILAGCWTESCILHTARAATEKADMLPSIIVKPATTGHFPMSFISLLTLQMLYADVVHQMKSTLTTSSRLRQQLIS